MTGLRALFLQWGVVALIAAPLLALGSNTSTPVPAKKPETETSRFHDPLLKIARTYVAYSRVDDQVRWAPFLCRRPLPGRVVFSRSSDTDTHGQKLYTLFARNRASYLKLPAESPVGQVIVKESWLPQEVKAAGKPTLRTVMLPPGTKINGLPAELARNGKVQDTFIPYTQRDGKWFKAVKQADLFIMYKTDPRTPGTDQGWVYGTVTADGKTVTSAGRVDSCMRCHTKAKHDRLFGWKAN